MTIISSIKFIILLFIWYSNGALFLNSIKLKNEAYSSKLLFNLVLNILSGLSLFLLLSHSLAFILHSYSKSLLIFIPISIIASLFYFFTKAKADFQKITEYSITDIVWTLISLYYASTYFIVDAFKTGSWDRVHHTAIETILSNDIYPPAAVASKHHIMDYYHYGIDLISCSISKFCSLRAWDALSLQLGLTDFLCLIMLYLLINYFIKSKPLSVFLSFFVFFYASFNHLNFFIEQFFHPRSFKPQELFNAFIIFAQPGLKNFNQRLFFYGQSIGFLLSLTAFYIKFQLIDKKDVLKISDHLLVALASFLFYFCYPSMWYPIVAAYAGYLGLKTLFAFFNKKAIDVLKDHAGYIISILVVCLGRYLTFCKSLSHYEGINLFPFSPSDYFNLPSQWFKLYMKFFIEPSEFAPENFATEAFNFSQDLKVHIFSQITFREFGALVILATILFLGHWIMTRKLDSSYLLYFSGIISCLVPYLFEYVLRPHEELRFFVFGKVVLLLFISIRVFSPIKKLRSLFTNWRVILIIPMILLILPFWLPQSLGVPLIQKNLLVSPVEKEFVRLMKTVLKSGDVCIDDAAPYGNAAPIGSLAGCYGVGYRLLRENTIRKQTALYTMDPNLLKELEVDYIIITEPSKVNYRARAILSNTKVFTRLFAGSKLPWLIFRFNKDTQFSIPQNFIWTVGIESPGGFKLIKSKKNKIIYAKDRESLEPVARRIRRRAAKRNDYSEAIWLDLMPIPKDFKDRSNMGIPQGKGASRVVDKSKKKIKSQSK